MSDKQMLLRAASELAQYINKENERLHRNRNKWDLDEPKYHDTQTCQELVELAGRIE